MSPAKKTATKSGTAKKPAAKTAQKKVSGKNKKDKSVGLDIGALILIAVGIFVLFCMYSSDSGVVGAWIAFGLMRIIGSYGGAIVGLCLILNGILILSGFKPITEKRSAGYIYALAFNITVMFCLTDDLFKGYSISEKSFYNMLVVTDSRGGILGEFTAKVLSEFLSGFGAWLLVILLSAVCIMVLVNKSIREVIKDNKLKVKQKHDDKITKDAKQLMFDTAPSLFIGDKKTSGATAKKGKNDTGSLSLASSLDDFFIMDEPEPGMLTKKGKDKPAAKKDSLFDDFDPDKTKNRKNTTPDENKTKTAQEAAADKNKTANEIKPSETDEKEAKPEKKAPKYVFPPYNLLVQTGGKRTAAQKDEVLNNAAHLEKTLSEFSIEARVTNISVGPTVTRYELQLQPGIRVSKVVNLADDLAMALAAQRVRIEAPIPGKSAIGIEVPNKEKATVSFSTVVASKEFKINSSPLAIALGQNLSGENLVMDITRMPHLLIAGATGSGKSVCIHTIIASILYHSSPDDVRMILIDPKMVELNVYENIPHLLIPVVTDAKYAAQSLNWAVHTMTERYKAFAEIKVKGIDGYNQKAAANPEMQKMPRIIIIIDELSDLMMVAAKNVETSICRIAQLARAAGIHLILATQRPSTDVITGLIKANIPSRISFLVATQVDSRVVLDMPGAEKLLGNGDMLYYPAGESKPLRAQCAYISEGETEKIADFIKTKTEVNYDESVIKQIDTGIDGDKQKADAGFEDELLPDAMQVAFEKGIISTSTIQRRLRIGYARAGRIVDEMEEKGYVTGPDGSRPRKVIITPEAFYGNDEDE